MSPAGYIPIAAIVAALHVLAFSLVLGPVHWQHLAVAVVSGIILWAPRPTLLRLKPSLSFFTRAFLAVAVQQTAFHLWRSKLGACAVPIAQFASIHILLALALGKLVRRTPMAKRETSTTV
jgi:hypothetical protein